MNSTTIGGEGTDLLGKGKETLGDATGNRSLQGEGVADQISGKVQKGIGSAKEAAAPAIAQAKGFAKARPFATAALVGVVGLAFLNTLRGR